MANYIDNSNATELFTDVGNKIKAQQSLTKDTVGWTGKNIFRYPWAMSTTSYGYGSFTYTDNGDGSLTVNGSHTSNSQFEFFNQTKRFEWLEEGVEYILSGAPATSESTDNCRLQITFRDINNENQIAVICPQGGEIKFTMPVGYHPWYFTYFVAANTTINNLVVKPMIRLATISDNTYEPYHESVEETLRGAEVVPSKNLLKNNLETSTFSGVTATHNADDSITLTNTATNNQWFGISAAGTINEFNVKLNANVTYVLSVGSNMPSGIALYGRDASENYLFRVESGASYAQYTPSNDIYINIGCRVSNGTATGGFTIYPMLCTLEEWEKSHTYEPYYVPVKDSKLSIKDQQVLGAWNQFNNTAVSQTVANVPITVNADKTMLLNGTATGNIRLNLGSVTLKAGTYYLSGGANSDFYLNIINTAINSTNYNGTEFTVTEETTYSIQLVENGTKTANNLVIKPMISTQPNQPYVPNVMTNKELTDKNKKRSTTLTYDDTIIKSFVGTYSVEYDLLSRICQFSIGVKVKAFNSGQFVSGLPLSKGTPNFIGFSTSGSGKGIFGAIVHTDGTIWFQKINNWTFDENDDIFVSGSYIIADSVNS